MGAVAELLGVIRRGDTKAVEDLLAAHPALGNARDEKGNSPVLMATYAGKQDIVRLLLDHGARPNFFEACALGLDADVRRQLRDDPGAARQWAHDGWTPLTRPLSTETSPSFVFSWTAGPIDRCGQATGRRPWRSPARKDDTRSCAC